MNIDKHTRKVAEAMAEVFTGECTTKLNSLPAELVERFGGGGGGGGSGGGGGGAMSVLLMSGRSGSGKSAAIRRAFPGGGEDNVVGGGGGCGGAGALQESGPPLVILSSMLASADKDCRHHAALALEGRVAELGFAAHFGLTPKQLCAKAGTRKIRHASYDVANNIFHA